MIVWLDGELLRAEEARIDPRDRGLLLGDGLFETMRAEDQRVFRLDAHLARLHHGAQLLDLPIPRSDAELAVALQQTIAANRLARRPVTVRLTLTRGAGGRGLLPQQIPRPTLLISAQAAPTRPSAPATAITATARRNECSVASQVKSLSYLDNVLAQREAAAANADEALLLNSRGNLAETARANLFIVEGGRLITPRIEDGALAGVTRDTVIGLAAQQQLQVDEQPIDPRRLRDAPEAFVTNTLVGVRPLVAVDNAPIRSGEPGALTGLIGEAYATLVARS